MFRRIIIPISMIAAGILGAVLRTICLNRSYEPEVALFRDSSAGTALAVLSCVVVAVSLVYAFTGPKTTWSNDGGHSYGGRTPMLAAGLLIFLAGLFFFFFSLVSFEFAGIVSGVLACLSGLAMLGLARIIPGRANEISQIFIIGPVFWSCFLLLMEYRVETVNPEIGMFIYRVLAIICAVTMFFQTAACFVRNGRISRLTAASWSAVYFTIIVLFADLPYFLVGILADSDYGRLASYVYLAGIFLFSLGIMMLYALRGSKKQNSRQLGG